MPLLPWSPQFQNSWGNIEIIILSKDGGRIIKKVEVDNSNLYKNQIEDFARKSTTNDRSTQDTKALNAIKLVEKIYKMNINS